MEYEFPSREFVSLSLSPISLLGAYLLTTLTNKDNIIKRRYICVAILSMPMTYSLSRVSNNA